MKLSNLNGQIRGADAVKVAWQTPIGVLAIVVQKTSLLAALKEACPDNKADVPLYVREDGFLMREGETQASRETALEGRPVIDVSHLGDVDDLLADVGSPVEDDLLADLLG